MHIGSYASGLLTGASMAIAALLLWQSFAAPTPSTAVRPQTVVVNQAPPTVLSPSLEELTYGYHP